MSKGYKINLSLAHTTKFNQHVEKYIYPFLGCVSFTQISTYYSVFVYTVYLLHTCSHVAPCFICNSLAQQSWWLGIYLNYFFWSRNWDVLRMFLDTHPPTPETSIPGQLQHSFFADQLRVCEILQTLAYAHVWMKNGHKIRSERIISKVKSQL